MTSACTSGSRRPSRCGRSMAAKHKQKKKSNQSSEISFVTANNEVNGEHDGDEEEAGKKGVKDEDEFNLDEVLKLGGTQVRFT